MKKFAILLLALAFSTTKPSIVHAQITPGDPGNFVTIWKTDNSGNSANNQIRIPISGTGYNYDVYWEDINDPSENGTVSNLSGTYTTYDLITFPQAGTYRVEISGSFPRIYFDNRFDRLKILSVEQWGDNLWTSMERAFEGAWNLQINATDAPDLSNVTSMQSMFDNARSINADLNHWNVSNVQDMSALFSSAADFNGDISDWVTDNVQNMSEMFRNALEFNGDISDWETGNVTDMSSMFYRAEIFNQDISNWDTGSVENMSSMFREATAFNQNIGGWTTNNVKNMSYMFYQASDFNQNIGGWNTGNVEAMHYMFYEAASFNQDLNDWETGSVTDMRYIFQDATSFNGDISAWNIENVTNMLNMFYQAASFNQDISGWNTSGVTSMNATFAGASSFNQNLGNWDITNLQTGSFNEMRNMLNVTALSRENYDATLNGWLSQDVPSNIQLGAGGLEYCAAGARATLINTYGWNFIGDSQALDCPPDADAGLSSVTATSPHQADGIDVATVTIVLRDDSNQPISGFTDGDFTVSLTGSASASAVSETATNGTYTFTVTNNVPETVTVTIFAGSTELDDQPEIEFESSVNPNSTVTATSPHTADGLDAATVSVELRDASNQPVTGFTDGDFGIQVTGSASASTVSESATSGTYTFTVTNTVKEVVTITVTAGGTELNANPEIAFLQDMESFITTWQTGDQILIPVETSGMTYDYDIYWEKTDDSSINGTITGITGDGIINVPGTGTYRVEIYGDFPSINLGRFNVSQTDKNKIQTVEQWGDIEWGSMAFAFYGAENLEINATDAPDLSNTTSLEGMFGEAVKVNSDLSHWDVSNIQNMRRIFQGKLDEPSAFNGNISSWDVGNVTDMQQMFQHATSFNRDITEWNVSGVENMAMMFQDAENFNQDIGYDSGTDEGWDVSSVEDMGGMFFGATAFNQDISGWDVSSVRNFGESDGFPAGGMFEDAVNFDQDLSNWNITAVTGDYGENMFQMFDNSGLSRTNYDALLIAWADLIDSNGGEPTGINLGAEGLTYCAVDERDKLIDDYGWNIDGDEPAVDCSPTFRPFITTWKTSNSGASGNNQIRIPMIGNGYDFTIEWGDGNSDTYNNNPGENVEHFLEHTYAGAGEYTVSITGDFPRIYFNRSGDNSKIISIDQWGDVAWVSMENAFTGTWNLNVIHAVDAPDLSSVESMKEMFSESGWFNIDLNHWDVSNVTNMSRLFEYLIFFNGDIREWDVSSVTDMSRMFNGAVAFNQDIGYDPDSGEGWDVSNVKDMSYMFSSSEGNVFNGDISGWDVSSVENMSGMFRLNNNFNADISGWDVSSVEDMSDMFSSAIAFNRDIGGWDVSNVEDMSGMFAMTSAFNQDISGWNISSLTSLAGIFNSANAFNQNLGEWDVSGVSDMPHLFNYSNLSRANYDATLIGWAGQTLQNGVTLGAFERTYCAESARNILVNTYGWEINGDELAEDCSEPAQIVGASNSSVTASSPHLADGVDQSNVTVVLRDENDDSITGYPNGSFVIGVTGSAETSVISESATEGTYTFTVTNEVAEVITVTVTVNGVQLDDQPEIDFETPPQIVDTENSTVTATTPHISNGTDTSVVTIVLVDMDEDPISGLLSDDFSLNQDGAGDATDVNETDIPGTYWFEVTSTTPGLVNFKIAAGGSLLDDIPVITFIKPVDPGESIVSATSPHIADGADASTVTVVVVNEDREGFNSLSEDDFLIELTGSATASGITKTPVVEGEYQFTVTNSEAETVSVTITVLGVELDDKPEIVFDTGVQVVDAENSSVTATSPHVADGVDTSIATIVLVGDDGEPVSGLGNEDFSISVTGDGVASQVSETGTAGTYQFTVTNTVEETVTVTITADDVELDDQPTITFEAITIVVDPLASSVTATTPHIADGVDASVVVIELIDDEGDPVSGLINAHFVISLSRNGSFSEITETETSGTYNFELTTLEEGEITISVTVLNEELDNTPSVLFEAPEQIVDANASELTVTEVHIADGVDASTGTVRILDEDGNPFSGLSSDHFKIDVTGDAVATEVKEIKSSGIYEFYVTNTTAEIVTVIVTVQGVQLTDQRKIIFEEPEQIVNPKSSIFASSPHLANGFDESVVEMKITDTTGNLIYGLKNEQFSIEKLKGFTVSDVKESGSTGIYRFSVTSTISGKFNLSVAVKGVKLSEAAVIIFEEDVMVISAENSEVYATSPHLADGEDESIVTILLRDEENQPVFGKTPNEFTVEIDGVASATSITETEQGTYTFAVTSTDAGSVKLAVTVSGIELGMYPVIEFEPVPAPIPGAPVILSLEEDENGILIHWNMENTMDIIRYMIYKGDSVQNLQPVAEVPVGVNAYTDSDLGQGTVFYAVSAVNSDQVEGSLSTAFSYFSSSIIASESEWRLVSASLSNTVTANQNTTLYGFSNQYELSTELVPSQGYWIKSNTYDSESIEITGSGLVQTDIDLKAGWNLIGSLSSPFNVSDISDPDGILAGAPVFGFAPTGYESVTQLEPNRGYWIYAGKTGSIGLHLSTQANQKTSSLMNKSVTKEPATPDVWLQFTSGEVSRKLWISEDPLHSSEEIRYLMPPVSPEPVLDIRTEQGLNLLSRTNDRIRVQSAIYPIQVSVHGMDSGSDYVWRLILQNSGEERILDLLPGNPAFISKEYDHIELEKVHVDDIITEHKLLPNYPNPFNPSTTLRYQLREQVHVSIEVYDAMGRRVQVLRNETQTSGAYSVQFNAAHVSSGLYFVRLLAGSDLHVQKITLIK